MLKRLLRPTQHYEKLNDAQTPPEQRTPDELSDEPAEGEAVEANVAPATEVSPQANAAPGPVTAQPASVPAAAPPSEFPSASLALPAATAVQPASAEVVINSTTCRSQWKILERVAHGPRAADFPGIASLFQGSKQEKLQALRLFMTSGQNLQSAEAEFQVQKKQVLSLKRNRRCLTIREMKEHGVSETLVGNRNV